MKKLSIKLGILFFLIIFGLMTFMFFFLHMGITETRVSEELQALHARGNSHRAILEKHFDKETINHVVLMEVESTTDVVITNQDGTILGSSSFSETLQEYINIPAGSIPKEGQIIEGNWEEVPYISTISPVFINDQIIGYVYMFENTESVHKLMNSLNEHFLLAGWISVFLTLIIIIFLTKGITKPLIIMKEVTNEISKGNFNVSLPKTSDDELGELAKSIDRLATELNYLKQQRSEFLASISHELRTPLTYIKGYTDIVNKRELSDEDKRKYLNIISDETKRLSILIKELFELAKIDQNSFVINKENIELTQFLKKMKQKLSPAFLEKHINFELECESNLFLMADPLKLEQILLNLLDNAKKYSSEGSKVLLKSWKYKNSIHITIEDNGRGIPEKDIPFIFNRFYRVDKARTRSTGGTGLGLAIAQELVHAHDGTIIVTSKENIGSNFELIFKGE
ncbi:ATP-binding protein [Robertmurraya massiliosenegalensis]|uniref:sensor histidine kinase n=1 Tax=Robertmurraya TaxID=2837507 RepID=UPI0039A61952